MDLLVALAALIDGFMGSALAMPAEILYVLVATIPLTLLHELGHGLVARRRLGADVHVVVGTSGRLADLRLCGVSVSLNALAHPGRRSGYAEIHASYATRRDVALIALGGPAASFAGFVLCAWPLSLVPDDGVLHDALWTLTAGGVFAWGLNLVRMTLREGRDGPMLRTDGRIVLDCLRAPRTTTPGPAAVPRARATSTATPSVVSTAGHLPLRRRGGAPLGVEPITRTSFPDMADDGLARRARRLSANRGRSVPPPNR